MLRIGITGGIGSGKSTVAKVFETLGIPVYYADEAAKRMLDENESLKKEIANHFGEAVLSNGEVDRKLLANLVFNDDEKLSLLNALVHPMAIEDANAWFSKQSGPYALKEAALLFESGATAHLDYVIGVQSPRALRIKRVMDRNQLTKEEVEKRISKQLQEDIKMKLCDYVITNNEQELIIPQVLELDNKFRELANKQS